LEKAKHFVWELDGVSCQKLIDQWLSKSEAVVDLELDRGSGKSSPRALEHLDCANVKLGQREI